MKPKILIDAANIFKAAITSFSACNKDESLASQTVQNVRAEDYSNINN
jgi:hypothetical protein